MSFSKLIRMCIYIYAYCVHTENMQILSIASPTTALLAAGGGSWQLSRHPQTASLSALRWGHGGQGSIRGHLP